MSNQRTMLFEKPSLLAGSSRSGDAEVVVDRQPVLPHHLTGSQSHRRPLSICSDRYCVATQRYFLTVDAPMIFQR